MSFVKSLQRIDARTLELRPGKALNKILAEAANFLRKNYAAIAVVEIIQFRSAVSLNSR